jgi:hypothetical protein
VWLTSEVRSGERQRRQPITFALAEREHKSVADLLSRASAPLETIFGQCPLELQPLRESEVDPPMSAQTELLMSLVLRDRHPSSAGVPQGRGNEVKLVYFVAPLQSTLRVLIIPGSAILYGRKQKHIDKLCSTSPRMVRHGMECWLLRPSLLVMVTKVK